MDFGNESYRLLAGDCLDLMKSLPDNSVDMILCDLPYGTTRNKWDTIIPFDALWSEYWRVAKPGSAVVLTAAQPFTSALVASQFDAFRHSLVYEKSHPTGHLNANRAPLRKHEDVIVFGKKSVTYNPQKTAKPKKNIRPATRGTQTENYGSFNPQASRTEALDVSFPTSVIRFNVSSTGGDKGLHPTQKPAALMEYLIRTYSNPGDTVLDNCMGSGTTGVGCINTGRRFIGMELDAGYFQIASDRIAAANDNKSVD